MYSLSKTSSPSVEDLRDYVNMLMKDKDEYQKYLDWKHQPYEWTSHPDFEKLRVFFLGKKWNFFNKCALLC